MFKAKAQSGVAAAEGTRYVAGQPQRFGKSSVRKMAEVLRLALRAQPQSDILAPLRLCARIGTRN